MSPGHSGRTYRPRFPDYGQRRHSQTFSCRGGGQRKLYEKRPFAALGAYQRTTTSSDGKRWRGLRSTGHPRAAIRRRDHQPRGFWTVITTLVVGEIRRVRVHDGVRCGSLHGGRGCRGTRYGRDCRNRTQRSRGIGTRRRPRAGLPVTALQAHTKSTVTPPSYAGANAPKYQRVRVTFPNEQTNTASGRLLRPTMTRSTELAFNCDFARSVRIASTSARDGCGSSSACVCHSPRYSRPASACSSMADFAAAGSERY